MIRTALALTALVAVTLAPTAAEPARPAATTFSVDPVHSALVFRIRYGGVSDFWGRFNGFSGTVAFDADAPEKTVFDVTVKTESVDSGNERRDGHLKSPDFFSAKEHPEITFKSKSVKKGSDGELAVTGDLSLRGVSKEVTATVKYGGETEARDGGKRIGFDGRLTIKRGDFGITFGEGMLGDDVEIIMGLTAVAK